MSVQVEKDREIWKGDCFSLIMSLFAVREAAIKLIPPALLLIPVFFLKACTRFLYPLLHGACQRVFS